MRFNLKIPAWLAVTLAAMWITAKLTYTPGDPYTDIGSWLPTVIALFGTTAAFYGAHLAGWLDWLDRSDPYR